ncbi:FAD-dependent oxidoreductase [Spongiactinospora sp. 9N601]|uniref:FAD-dependent oxidoreductase n=1 Tax=Spongiactinospora sp. 9N601 TaxID=3375149 RepID=UPI00379813EC
MDVLIVGGGLSGLATAAFLAARGIPATVVERRPEIPRAPRNHLLSDTTMRLLDAAGLGAAVRGIALGRPGRMFAVDTLADRDKTLIHTPAEGVSCNERALEELLLAEARRRGAEVRMGVEVMDPEAEYVIAADDGTIRKCLGIGVHGPGRIGLSRVIRFRADLADLAGRDGYLVRSVRGILLPEEPGTPGTWSLTVPEAADPARQVAAALGAGRAAELLGVTTMEIAGRVADRFVCDRVILMAKSAYTAPPVPGLHGDSRVQDAHHVAETLATGAPLDTYDQERRPAAERAMARALSERFSL